MSFETAIKTLYQSDLWSFFMYFFVIINDENDFRINVFLIMHIKKQGYRMERPIFTSICVNLSEVMHRVKIAFLSPPTDKCACMYF